MGRAGRMATPTLRVNFKDLHDRKALLSGRAWNGPLGEPVRLAYHFAEVDGLPDYYKTSASPSLWRDGFTPFDQAQRESARRALAAWAEAGGVRFETVTRTSGTIGYRSRASGT